MSGLTREELREDLTGLKGQLEEYIDGRIRSVELRLDAIHAILGGHTASLSATTEMLALISAAARGNREKIARLEEMAAG